MAGGTTTVNGSGGPTDGFAFTGEFEERVEIFGHAAYAVIVGDGFFQALAGLHDFLAFFGLVPEVGGGDLGFAFG